MDDPIVGGVFFICIIASFSLYFIQKGDRE